MRDLAPQEGARKEEPRASGRTFPVYRFQETETSYFATQNRKGFGKPKRK